MGNSIKTFFSKLLEKALEKKALSFSILFLILLVITRNFFYLFLMTISMIVHLEMIGIILSLGKEFLIWGFKVLRGDYGGFIACILNGAILYLVGIKIGGENGQSLLLMSVSLVTVGILFKWYKVAKEKPIIK